MRLSCPFSLRKNKKHLVWLWLYPNRFLQVDSRGVKTVKIPLNGVDIAEVRYESGVVPHKELTYLHNNYQNSPVLTTNETGQVMQNNWYNVWGTRIATSTATTTIQSREGYTGHITDEETGLTYAHARYLSTANKVWTQQDPMMWDSVNTSEFLENPQVQNSYSYARNNPTSYTDPDGRNPFILVPLAGLALGVTGEYVSDVAKNLYEGQGVSTYWIPRTEYDKDGNAISNITRYGISGAKGLVVSGAGLFGGAPFAIGTAGGTSIVGDKMQNKSPDYFNAASEMVLTGAGSKVVNTVAKPLRGVWPSTVKGLITSKHTASEFTKATVDSLTQQTIKTSYLVLPTTTKQNIENKVGNIISNLKSRFTK